MTLQVLVVCTANRCRSVLAGALLERAAAERGLDLRVRTTGLVADGSGPVEEAARAAARRGLDVSRHRSTRLARADLTAADLVVGLERRHVREAVAMSPQVWPRAFALRELVQRAEAAGPRLPGQPWSQWVAAVGAGRRPADLVGAGRSGDVADPTGGPEAAFETLLDDLDDLVRRFLQQAAPAAVRGAAS